MRGCTSIFGESMRDVRATGPMRPGSDIPCPPRPPILADAAVGAIKPAPIDMTATSKVQFFNMEVLLVMTTIYGIVRRHQAGCSSIAPFTRTFGAREQATDLFDEMPGPQAARSYAAASGADGVAGPCTLQ